MEIGTWAAVVAVICTIASAGITVGNAWLTTRVTNEILKLRIYVTDNFVRKSDLNDYIERLGYVTERMEKIAKRRDERE